MADRTEFRPIDTAGFAAIDRPAEFGPVPDQRWLPIASLVVDPSYQRDVTGSGRNNVRRIAETFSWCKFSPVICSPVPGGSYAIIDGQHRTTAAALLGFRDVPCQVVVAGRREQAEAFTAINGNTTRMTGQAMFAARVASGDPAAAEIQAACAGCGVTILRYAQGAADMKPGQTLAVGAGGRLIEAFDELDLEELLEEAQVAATRRAGVTAGVLLQAKLVDALEKKLQRKASA